MSRSDEFGGSYSEESDVQLVKGGGPGRWNRQLDEEETRKQKLSNLTS